MEVKPNPQYSTCRTSPHLSRHPTPVDAAVLVQHGTCKSDTGIPAPVHTIPHLPTPVDAVVLAQHGTCMSDTGMPLFKVSHTFPHLLMPWCW